MVKFETFNKDDTIFLAADGTVIQIWQLVPGAKHAVRIINEIFNIGAISEKSAIETVNLNIANRIRDFHWPES